MQERTSFAHVHIKGIRKELFRRTKEKLDYHFEH